MPRCIVLTHEYWQARFGGDPSVVGRAVRLNGKPFTIIGVTAQSFDKAHSLHPRRRRTCRCGCTTTWRTNSASDSILESRGQHQLWVLGRLNARCVAVAGARGAGGEGGGARPGVSSDEQGLVAGRHSRDARPSEPEHRPLLSVWPATAFAALAALLLLITSANVTNLLMARAVVARA